MLQNYPNPKYRLNSSTCNTWMPAEDPYSYPRVANSKVAKFAQVKSTDNRGEALTIAVDQCLRSSLDTLSQ
ncbi:hypothetical protein MHYP_G00103100 [Metynnis hypsauchen]